MISLTVRLKEGQGVTCFNFEINNDKLAEIKINAGRKDFFNKGSLEVNECIIPGNNIAYIDWMVSQ